MKRPPDPTIFIRRGLAWLLGASLLANLMLGGATWLLIDGIADYQQDAERDWALVLQWVAENHRQVLAMRIGVGEVRIRPFVLCVRRQKSAQRCLDALPGEARDGKHGRRTR